MILISIKNLSIEKWPGTSHVMKSGRSFYEVVSETAAVVKINIHACRNPSRVEEIIRWAKDVDEASGALSTSVQDSVYSACFRS